MHSPTRTGAFSTYTHTYFHTSAYLSSCSESRGSSRFEHKLRNKISKFEPFADGLQPSTCIELLCTAWTDEAAVMSHWVCFSLYDYKNINHNTWPHGKCYYFIEYSEAWVRLLQKGADKETTAKVFQLYLHMVYILPNVSIGQYHFCLGWHHVQGFQTYGNCSFSPASCVCLH